MKYSNIISQMNQNQIEEFLIGEDQMFSWFYGKNTRHLNHIFRIGAMEHYQNLYLSKILDLLDWQNTLKKLNIPNKVYQMKANLYLQEQSSKPNPAHIDFYKPHQVVLYYVNNSDGDTILYDKVLGEDPETLKEIERFHPNQGDFVVFDGLRYHSSSSPIENFHRCTLNFTIDNLELGL